MIKTHDRRDDLVNDIGITITNGKGAMIELTGPTVTSTPAR